MYTIVNTSGRHLSIKDLRIMLSPRERLDLDSVCERRDIESSLYLKEALKKGYIKVIIKDSNSSSYASAGMIDAVTKEDLEKIKSDISDVIKSSMKEAKVAKSSLGVDISQIKSEIASVIREVMGEMNISSPSKDVASSGFEESLSDSVLSEIHKKAVNRMMEGAEGKVKNDDQKKVNLDISRTADELEGLL